MMRARPLVFIDSNVLIEALFYDRHPAGAVIALALSKQIKLITCRNVIDDVEAEILERCEAVGDLALVDTWHEFVNSLAMLVEADASQAEFESAYGRYLPVMRHAADIPILAVAIRVAPSIILSGNREHFNEAVAERCGIKILSCKEFFAQLISSELKLTV